MSWGVLGGGGGARAAGQEWVGGEGFSSFDQMRNDLAPEMNDLWSQDTWQTAFGDSSYVARGGDGVLGSLAGQDAVGWGSGANAPDITTANHSVLGNPGIIVIRYEMPPDTTEFTFHKTVNAQGPLPQGGADLVNDADYTFEYQVNDAGPWIPVTVPGNGDSEPIEGNVGDKITVREDTSSVPSLGKTCWSDSDGTRTMTLGAVPEENHLEITNTFRCIPLNLDISKEFGDMVGGISSFSYIDVNWSLHTGSDGSGELASGTTRLRDSNSWQNSIALAAADGTEVWNLDTSPYLTLTENVDSWWGASYYWQWNTNTPSWSDSRGNHLGDGYSITLPYNLDDPEGGTRLSATVTNSQEQSNPSWTVWKDSDPVSGSEVKPGDTITYTLHAKNTGDTVLGNLPPTGWNRQFAVTDHLYEVLQHASMVSTPEELGEQGLSFGWDELRWELPELAPDEEASVSFVVKVNDDAFDERIVNDITAFGEVSPSQCAQFSPSYGSPIDPGVAPCGTTHTTPSEPFEPTTPTMPPLGGSGAWMFTVAGVIILAGAGSTWILVRNSRKAEG